MDLVFILPLDCMHICVSVRKQLLKKGPCDEVKDCDIVVCILEFLSGNYEHFQTKNFGNGMRFLFSIYELKTSIFTFFEDGFTIK